MTMVVEEKESRVGRLRIDGYTSLLNNILCVDLWSAICE